MPINRSKLEAALKKMQLAPAPQQAPKDDSAKLLQQVLVEVASKPHIKGDKGDPGRTPIKGIDYYSPQELAAFLRKATPRKGVDYFDGETGERGEKGDPGRDGTDGVSADPSEMREIAENEMRIHKEVHDHTLLHDSKKLGRLELDESQIEDGHFLYVKGDKIITMALPQVAQMVQPWMASQGVSSVRSFPITANASPDAMGIYVIDASGGNITITLPSASGRENHWFEFIRIDDSANTVTIVPTGSETMSGMTEYVVQQWTDVKVFAYNQNYLIRQAS